MNVSNLNLDYDRPVKIADDVYWVGFYDTVAGLHCNPYLIVDGDEAVVIDGGSRPHFPVVMMKVLQTGLDPSTITALICQHYDPDLCGSVPNFEDIIGRDDLRVISDANNIMFISHYSVSSKMVSLDVLNKTFTFQSGRKLHFHHTPYCHSAGSFVTFDEKTGVLFTSDLFGSYGGEWQLFLDLGPDCAECNDFGSCPAGRTYCPFPDILRFHRSIMTSERALKYCLEQLVDIPFKLIAPQHGSVIHKPRDIIVVFEKLARLKSVGIDRLLGDRAYSDMGRVEVLRARLDPDGK